MTKYYAINLELYDEGPRQTDIRYTSGDALTMPLNIKLLRHGEPLEADAGSLARLDFKNTYSDRGWTRLAAILPGGELLYNLDPSDIALPGSVTVTVTVISGGGRLTWPGFQLMVDAAPIPEQTVPPDYLTSWTTAVTEQLSGHGARISALESGGGGEIIKSVVSTLVVTNDDIDALFT